MNFFENRRFSKLFSSLREKSTNQPKFTRNMFSSFRVNSTCKPLTRKLSFKSKSFPKSDKISRFSLSGHQGEWHINPLYVSADQARSRYNYTYADPQSGKRVDQQTDLVKHDSSSSINPQSGVEGYQQTDLAQHTSSSSGVSSGSFGLYSSNYGGSSSGISSGSSCVSLIQNEYSNHNQITNQVTPTVPTAFSKLRLVRRRISSSSQSDADFEIHINEYYTRKDSELLNRSSSGIPSDDEPSLDNSYQNCNEDFIDNIRNLLQLKGPQCSDCINIGMLESSH